MKKIFPILVAGLFVWSVALFSSSVDAHPGAGAITNVEFAKLLMVPIANEPDVEVPPELENLSDEEHFEAISNILASYGIDNFIDSEAGRVITIRDMVNVLYPLAGGEGDPGIERKVRYMVDNEYMPPVDDVDAEVSSSLAAEVIKNINFGPIVAEAYSPPEIPKGWLHRLGMVKEDPATRIR